eukprot:1936422-Pleurochrysis_carterae.AAC.1
MLHTTHTAELQGIETSHTEAIQAKETAITALHADIAKVQDELTTACGSKDTQIDQLKTDIIALGNTHDAEMETLKHTHANIVAVKQAEFDTSLGTLRGQIEAEETAHLLTRTELETVTAEKTMLTAEKTMFKAEKAMLAASLKEMEESHAAAIEEITRLNSVIVSLQNETRT